jgi:hypothetical protein
VAVVVGINQDAEVRRLHKCFPESEAARLNSRRRFSAFNPTFCRTGRVNAKRKTTRVRSAVKQRARRLLRLFRIGLGKTRVARVNAQAVAEKATQKNVSER